MQQFSKFTAYIPGPEEQEISTPGYSGEGLYIRDREGNDWYVVRKLFKKDSLKVGYDEEGRVRTFSTDTDAFFPVNLGAVELPATKANMCVTLGDDWFYKDGKLQQIRDYPAIAAAERDRLMSEVTKRIDWLIGALEDSDISDDEDAELEALRAYRTALRRLDLTAAPVVKWPEVPQSVA
ncbi:tail fiber assembly protein [Cedecea sp.]|jgi:hypothetical protein|uniref:tail fiber assembly protein n=1 Tax=Cedecea sp. TaxID=1970739 RepID=UPI002F41C304